MEFTSYWVHWWDLLEAEEILRYSIGAEMMIIVLAAVTLTIWHRWVVINQFRLRWGIRRELKLLNQPYSPVPEASHYRIRTTFFLVQLIHAIDRNLNQNEKAEAARRRILLRLLLPRAKKLAGSRWPGRRALALSCFRLLPRINDEQLVMELMRDPVPVIRVGAARVALKIGTTESVHAILDFLSQQRRYVHNLMRVSVREASEDFVEKIRTRLRAERNPRLQKICLDLIRFRLNDDLDGEWVCTLARSENRDLRISAMRALCRSGCKGSYSVLSRAMTDPAWQVRATACRLMGEHQFAQGLSSLVKAAKDSHWWVRRNSTLSLAELGIAGQNALNEIIHDQDKYSAEIAKSALMAAKKAG